MIAVDRPAARRLTRWPYPAVALVLVVLLLFPLGAGAYLVLTVSAALAFGLFALSYDLMLGVAGLISVSHATLFGVGAYGMAISLTRLDWGFWRSVLVGLGAAGAVAWLIGFFSLRTSGAGFIIMTVIFAHAFEILANTQTALTGGENGIVLGLSRIAVMPGLAIQATAGSRSLYYAVVLCLLTALWAARRLVQSRFGLVLRAIKGNEARAMAVGYPVSRYKILLNIIAGTIAALAGILYAVSQGFVSVDLLRVLLSVEVVVWTIVGGPGTLVGPVLAAVFLTLLLEYVRGLTQHYLILIGLVALAVIVAIPEGLAGVVERVMRQLSPRPFPGPGPLEEES
jgi:branched-chain amino acid transport system permease protein